ncbi:MAG: hypothetical protein V4498_02060 [candidate division FCPU426 bacterium]
MRRIMIILGMGLLGLAAADLHATAEGAKAAYMRGVAKSAAKDYQGAITEYLEALVESPRYVYANKQMGTCYYHLGNVPQAIKNYEIYLAVYPNDTEVRNFTDHLKQSGAPEEASEDTLPQRPAEERPLLQPGFYLGFGSTSLANDGSDVRRLYGTTSTSYSGSAYEGDFYGGYHFLGGFGIEAGFQSYQRIASVTYAAGYYYAYQDDFYFSESVFYAEPLFRQALSRRSSLIAGVKLGYAADLMRISAYEYRSSGPVYAPELRYQYLLGPRWSFELGAEYRIADLSPVKDSTGDDIYYSAGGEKTLWHVVNSGLGLRFGLNFYFNALAY